VGRWEREVLSFLHGKHQDLLDEIRTKKDLGPVEDRLKTALAAFAENFA
jgi:F-type H+-transporting ATPase subunit alpha